MPPKRSLRRAAGLAVRVLELREHPISRREVVQWLAFAVVAGSCPELGIVGDVLAGGGAVAAVALAALKGVHL